jgi:probable lipoprotein NlpC
MKYYFCLFGILLFSGIGMHVFAAPLEKHYAPALTANASKEEKDAALWDARFRVLAAAGRYEKTPYRYGGLDHNGIDCSGLVYASYREALSVMIPRSAGGLYAWSEKINTNKLQPGDLVFFKTDNSGNVSHVGIFTGEKRFIHAASAGNVTGVIYSDLDESYWKRTFFSAGRVLPEAYGSAPQLSGNRAYSTVENKPYKAKSSSAKSDNPFSFGIAAAPTWNAFLSDGKIIRGISSNIRVSAEATSGRMNLGLELRPEWDGALGIFRLPITFSWGLNEKFSIFGGPVVSFGNALLKTTDGDRNYSNGTTWFGAAGINVAPFAVKINNGELAPYGELAWQSYFSNNSQKNFNADFAAGFRFSTGLRYTWKL